jgi:antitoxin component YwqK of YwqJK toxin-antitoxin module
VQTPDGLIHLMASKGKPSMHFAMNEAWILSAETNEIAQTTDPAGKKIVNENEKWPTGKTRLNWSWFKAGNGTPVLQGKETWFYENGSKQYEVTHQNGKKLGPEECFRPDGSKQWTRDYQKDGGMVWISYWPNGVRKSESNWQGSWAQGLTTDWNPDGKVIRKINFKDGRNLVTASNPGDD